MNGNLRITVLIGLGALVVGGLVVTALRPAPVPVDLAEIGRGSLTITVNAEGETRVRDIYEISAPIAGTLLRLPLGVGDPVVAGETVVARVEPVTAPLLDARSRAEARAALHEAEAAMRFAAAEVDRTLADLAFAQLQYDRVRDLVASDSASISRLDEAGLRLALAKAAVTSAEASAAMARASHERALAVLNDPDPQQGLAACCVTLHAPADGVVLSQSSVSARPVVPGEFLLSVGDPSDLEIVVDLLSSDATRLTVGAPASLERWGGPEALPATLRAIEPTARTVVSALGIEEQRVEAVLEIAAPPEAWTGLGDGYAVFVRIEEWSVDDVLLVPLAAIFRQQDQWFAYIEADGQAEVRAIEIGRRDGRHAVIEAGLTDGERVVLHPPDTVVDGTRIAPRDLE
jgi:HlyD family secretion protein